MDWRTVLSIASQSAPIGSLLAAIIGALFIVRQIANVRRSREVDTLLKIIALADDDKMREAITWLTYELNRTLTIQELIADRETFSKFSRAVHLFETMGVIVNNGYNKESLIFDKYGLLIIGAWGKLQGQIKTLRKEWESNEYAENFELLVSNYDRWAKKTRLKRAYGKRVTLDEGGTLLEYAKQTQDKQQPDQIGA